MSARPHHGLSPEAFASTLADARSGMGAAWETLYHALAPAVAGYFRGQGAREPDDLTSEVFLALVKSIGRFAGDGAQFRSFVFVIAHNRLQDERRKTIRRNGFVQHQPVDDMGDTVGLAAPGDASDGALEQLSREHVRALCDSLMPDQRDVVLLRIVGDLTVEQVADVVGKSPGAVKALQRRAFEQLRRKLSANAEEAVPR